MITTIQLSESSKKVLDRLKSNRETFEEVILRLVDVAEKHRREQEQLLIEGCKEMYGDSLRIAKEWEGTLMDGLDKNERWNHL